MAGYRVMIGRRLGMHEPELSRYVGAKAPRPGPKPKLRIKAGMNTSRLSDAERFLSDCETDEHMGARPRRKTQPRRRTQPPQWVMESRYRYRLHLPGCGHVYVKRWNRGQEIGLYGAGWWVEVFGAHVSLPANVSGQRTRLAPNELVYLGDAQKAAVKIAHKVAARTLQALERLS